ncbi:hypothetical protein [Paenibacillus sp. RUD330]|uniref:hypothetical protein n=1 Tax=Paenibacillus sp. RUD330 TaxID=2023772 RepID=UPI000B92AFF3|nr:hypothetical protein [Paenibacillus sp. RUD330]ASS66254.1 hypothetical protein CIC07_08885 [Paenibacillus sp. RUD330]
MFTYVAIGVFDVFAVFALALKIYRQPLKEWILQIGILAIILSITSYYLRVRLNLYVIDFPLQAISFLLFFRYVMQYRFIFSSIMIATTLLLYLDIQLIIYQFMTLTGMDENFLSSADGFSAYILQVCGIILAFLVAAVYKVFNFGFAFIAAPPHSFYLKEDYNKLINKGILLSNIAAFIIILGTLFIFQKLNSNILFFISLAVFGMNYYLSKRRDLN